MRRFFAGAAVILICLGSMAISMFPSLEYFYKAQPDHRLTWFTFTIGGQKKYSDAFLLPVKLPRLHIGKIEVAQFRITSDGDYLN